MGNKPSTNKPNLTFKKIRSELTSKLRKTTDKPDVLRVREKYSHFRILVIGRANAGKTTLLKRVCNTLDDPIYDEENKNLLEPTAGRGIHDINRAFRFTSNPGFIFHDSPGFEAGGDHELKEAQSFIAKRAKSTEVGEQLHVVWFCFTPDSSRPLLELEQRFFNEARAGNVPVIAVFTKFDDLVIQVFNRNLKYEENLLDAECRLRDKFEIPLKGYNFPPKAYVRLEGLHNDDGDHQDQVKVLIEKTAGSLDDPELATLFVSIQQNNLELCVKFAVNHLHFYINSGGAAVCRSLVLTQGKGWASDEHCQGGTDAGLSPMV